MARGLGIARVRLQGRRGGVCGGAVAPAGLAGPAVYIIIGQSNAMGRTTALSSPPALPRSDVRCSVYIDGTIDGSSPRSLDQFTYKGAETGLGVTLADAGRTVAISKWAWNSTSMLSNWTPWMGDASGVTTSALLSDSIVQTRTFIDQLISEDSSRQPYVAGVFWSQWESDASGTLANAEMYVQELRVLIERLRAEFHPELPVWISTISNNFGGDAAVYTPANLAAIDAAHAAVASEYDGVELVDTDGLTFVDEGASDIHYTSDSQYTIGASRLAPLVLAAPVPDYLTASIRRVSLYANKAAAEAAGSPVYMSPADSRVWAVEDPAGAHFIPAAEWPVAIDKAMRFFPNTQSLVANKVVGGTVLSADATTLNTGTWYMRVRPGYLSTSETTLRRLLHKSTAYSVYYLGSSKQFNVRMNSVDALSTATTFNGTTDEFVIAVDFTNTTNNVSFYKNGALINTVSQANNFGGSALAISIGTAAYATTNQWVGEFDEPVAGAFSP